MDRKLNTSILVTGGTGFLGSYLLRYLLNEGYTNIRAIRRKNSKMDLLNEIVDKIEWVEGDVLDIIFLEEAMKGIQQVYHCAAIVSFQPKDFRKMHQVNVEGTANIVNAALHAGVRRFLHVSSISALGRSKDNKVISEKTKWETSKINSHYAVSKFRAEQEAWRGWAEGMDVVVVNPSLILGSGRWDEGPLRIMRLVWKNYRFYPTGETGYVDVRDVAKFMILLMESDIVGERYILNAVNVSLLEYMSTLARHLDKKKPTIKVNKLFAQIAWRLEWLRSKFTGISPLVTRETALISTSSFQYQNEKSKQVFNFEYIPFEETISKTCQQFKEASVDGFASKVLPLS